ncbi:16S rRNA (guanine(966)-N(2))-methyltransferase RsmD [Ligilactobacillus acidipiscis]|jgi:16S rRNA (guanine(966)-N(2))-methyltransferase RsmD|uniref:16S rRNA (guanine(966)-N(2))-methyltransferase RsmD n=1 Tax=Ligilactobacillus acidipiscis TaxID=89059 RepID=UPI0029FD9FC1|nr:16S rRNA (guanine(966)-N(2))-methyltransferase RsmD [Ligilactobacillus acidipiscis]MCI1953832.1 16S rRNA (guanine(966)-N(2))-methyltransferase RsmD [Ligilactobacillus acidipiscis]
MRVVAGNYKGRRLKAVNGMKTRPTTDKVKESMFNIIGPYFDGGHVLDVFAGSGALGIEAVSRGADHAILIDRSYQAIKTINENVALTKEPQRFSVVKGDSFKIINSLAEKQEKFSYVFFDPPYREQKIVIMIQTLVKLQLLAKNAVIVCETDQNAHLPVELADFDLLKQVDYGITELTYYEYNGGEDLK